MRLSITAMMACLLTVSCSPEPEKIDVDFGNLPALSQAEESQFADNRKSVVARFNANARETNKRLKAAYDRGVKVCENLKKAGYREGNGCPRPKPKYVELLRS